ncbi:MAG: aminotransferase class I/II-fold pyridoxal phosphate-dependent enzyme [Eubacteriales bacterium]|nr:aminotransferase class I/II-fold pyridoxal phosphate-dependent enzyme [Eubacteriales bacterium]
MQEVQAAKIKALTKALDQMPHGGDLRPLAQIIGCKESEILDFSANLNPFAPAPEILAAIRTKLDQISRYPDPEPRDLIQALARAKQLPAAEIFIGHGAADLITRLALALRLIRPQGEAVCLPLPNFSAYARAFKAAEWELKTVNHIYSSEPVDLASCWQEEEEALLLCHPNNPSGLLYAPAELEALLRRAVELQKFLIVDQCFLNFLPAERAARYDIEKLAAKIPGAREQLVCLYSLTKFYSIPGLRLGYLHSANCELNKKLSELTPPWPLNYPAELAGLAALKLPAAEQEEERLKIQALRLRQKQALKALNRSFGREIFSQITGEANFIAFCCSESNLAARLLAAKKPIYIRQLKTVPGAPENSYRIAVRDSFEQELLNSALKAVIQAAQP